MTIVYYQHSFDALLSAVFDIFDRKICPVDIRNVRLASHSLLDEMFMAVPEDEKMHRVCRKLHEIDSRALALLWKAFLSEQPGTENLIYHVIKLLVSKGGGVLENFGHPDILRLRQLEKMMNREAHRMTAFVRFEKSEDGIYLASIEPDFDVLPLIREHFEERFADQRWLIFDRHRSYGLYYDLEKVEFVEMVANRGGQDIVAEPEPEYGQLWSIYFKSTNIAARKNTRLHLRHVPKRYWIYLTEKKI